jgi:hypothetical protein
MRIRKSDRGEAPIHSEINGLNGCGIVSQATPAHGASAPWAIRGKGA